MDARTRSAIAPLPYVSLPPAFEIFFQNGLRQKFSPDAIKSKYTFTADNSNGRQEVNWAAFTSDAYHDLDTAAITVYYDPDEHFADQTIVERIAFAGAPFVFIGRQNEVLPYGIHKNGKVEPIRLAEGYPYERIPEFFERFGTDINPGRISAVKNGTASFEAFANINAYQLRLFALDITRDLLAETFASAVLALRKPLKNLMDEREITNYAVKLLGAIILAHKGRLGSACQTQTASFDFVYKTASRHFPAYFDLNLQDPFSAAVQDAYSHLQRATYSSFTPDMLSELYLQAYPDREKRKREGRFDTPLYLTRKILQNIPLETIRPEKRLLLDMTCGWGSFLVSGYERFIKLADMEYQRSSLWNHIRGNDIDPFTTQLAQVTLLTTSLSDSWLVSTKDALDLTHSMFDIQPTVIVGNPPFEGDRKLGARATETDENTGSSKRFQKADKFLIQAIDLLAPGGYLGMIVPQSFSVSEAGTQARKSLLERCDVLEFWDLPMHIFGDQASVNPMVIFAQKRGESDKLLKHPVRVRSAQGKSLERSGIFSASNVSPSQAEWDINSKKSKSKKANVTHIIKYKTILSQLEWNRIFHVCKAVNEIADITQGAIVGTRRRWKNYSDPKWVPWLSGVKETMPTAFCIRYGSEHVLYPNELEEPRKNSNLKKDKEKLLQSAKVLLVADPNPSWGQRAKVAIERRGYYVSNSFWALAPKQDTVSLEVLAAVLSWKVSNALMIENLRYPWIQKSVLESIPVPNLSQSESRKIENAIHLIELAAEQGQKDTQAEQIIDEILIKAYGLDDATFQRLRRVMEWGKNPDETQYRLPTNPKDFVLVSGSVDSVNVQDNTIQLWFDGIPEKHTLPIVNEMPGWMLREGASFSAEVSYDALLRGNWDALSWVNIYCQEYTYLSEEELIKKISDTLSS
jgi:hypothetical protein